MNQPDASPAARVLLVTGAYFPQVGSGGLQCQSIARVLGRRVEFRVLTTATDRGLAAEDVVEGVPVSRVIVDVKRRASRIRAAARLVPALLRLVPQVDLVHVHGFSQKNIAVAAVARWFRRPVVLSLHTAGHDEPDAVAAQGRAAWWAYSSADLYLSVSQSLTERFVGRGLPADRIRQAPNGVDVERFAPATPDERTALRRDLGLPNDRPLILFVGIFARDKQPGLLFAAWRRLQLETAHASTLVFVGATSPTQFEADQRLAADIREEANRSGLADRVVFVAPTHRIQDYFRAADIFVLPSVREGMPVVLLEAMSCGLPAVASRLPGSTDVMIDDHVDGWLIPPGDERALEAALSALLADPARAWRLGAAARRTVEQRYSVTRTADHWLAAYRQVLGS